ncbi:MAG TPA: GNAT family N-acetyltransferase [Mycobacteriales bacterium]|nr:GNAT family N-acetyltransferase [Mycobacteriales bacterium]
MLENPPAWRALLADGRPIDLRSLGSTDLEALLELHQNLSEHSNYLRFFSVNHVAGETFVRRAIREEGVFSHSILAEAAGRIVGMATYHLLDTPTSAEVSLIVADDYQAKGIGTLLLEHLVSAGRRHGVTLFVAEVLSENSPMIDVFSHAGLSPVLTRHGSTISLKIPLAYDERYLDAVAAREQHADRASLRPLLEPRNVAVIGAGRGEHSVGRAVVRRLLDAGFGGSIHPVNPHADRIEGLACVHDISAITDDVDVAVVCVPAAAVPAVAQQCAERGIPAIVVVSGGLGSDKTDSPGAALRSIVSSTGIRMVGPNCLGIANTAIGMDATFSPEAIPAGHLGVVTQSGGVGIALTEMLRHAGLGISTFVSTGDKYDVSSNDLLLWWSADADTHVAVVYVESFGNPRKFSRLARRLALQKPVIAVRAGASEIAQRAARSHTAATATPAVTRDALFRQAGIIAVDDLSQCVETAALLQTQPLPRGSRIAILSNAGGAGVIAADACARAGLTPVDLTPGSTARLGTLLPDGASLSNPVDTTAGIQSEEFLHAIEIVQDDSNIDALLLLVAPTAIAHLEQVFPRIRPHRSVPIIGVELGQNSPVHSVPTEGGPSIPVYSDPGAAVRALAHATAYARWQDRAPGVVPDLDNIDPTRARSAVTRYLSAFPEGGWLDAAEIAEIAASYGLPILPTSVAGDEAAVTAIMRGLPGPVAMKAVVPGMIHRSDRGGVALDIPDTRAARRQFREFRRRFGPQLRAVQIQPMVAEGTELLVGVTQDESFGPLVQVGSGGTTTDIAHDRTARLLPITDRDAAEMLAELRIAPLLTGFRGLPPCDQGAIADTIHRVAKLAEDIPEIVELDINPLVAHREGCSAADLKIRLNPARPHDPYLREKRVIAPSLSQVRR